jgi:hypothetical protein
MNRKVSVTSDATRNFWRGGAIVIEKIHFLSNKNESVCTPAPPPFQVFQPFRGGGSIPIIPAVVSSLSVTKLNLSFRFSIYQSKYYQTYRRYETKSSFSAFVELSIVSHELFSKTPGKTVETETLAPRLQSNQLCVLNQIRSIDSLEYFIVLFY